MDFCSKLTTDLMPLTYSSNRHVKSFNKNLSDELNKILQLTIEKLHHLMAPFKDDDQLDVIREDIQEAEQNICSNLSENIIKLNKSAHGYIWSPGIIIDINIYCESTRAYQILLVAHLWQSAKLILCKDPNFMNHFVVCIEDYPENGALTMEQFKIAYKAILMEIFKNLRGDNLKHGTRHIYEIQRKFEKNLELIGNSKAAKMIEVDLAQYDKSHPFYNIIRELEEESIYAGRLAHDALIQLLFELSF